MASKATRALTTSSVIPLACADRTSARLNPNVHAPAAGPLGESDRQQARGQGAGVGQHVTGVRQQRQRMTGEGHDDLEDQERGDQSERDGDEPAVRAGGHAMPVPVLVAGAAVVVAMLRRLRVLSAAVGHLLSRSGCIAVVCWL